MEAQTVPPETAEQPAAVEAQAERSPAKLFQWSGWVHVGEGAEECEQRFTGKCSDEEHFHAWCRLPNPYQQRDLADKGRAAKARKIRAMKDPESDSHIVLGMALDELREMDDAQELLVDEAMNRDFTKDFEAALMRVEGEEEFENHTQDREEYLRLRALPEEERPEEEWANLEKYMVRYGEAADAELKRIQEPRREALRQKSLDELIALARRERIESAGNEAYLHAYNTWMYYVCTLKPRGIDGNGKPLRPTEMVFTSIADFKSAAREVIDAIQDTFGALEEQQVRGRAAKNS